MLTTQKDSHERQMRTVSASQRRIAPSIQINLSGPAVQKILDFLLPAGVEQPQTEQIEAHHLRPTLRPWIGIIDQILKDDAQVPRRYRTTVMRILRILREEHGFTGGYTVVQEYVRRARDESGQSPSRRSQNVQKRSPRPQPVIRAAAVTPLPAKTTNSCLTVAPRPLRLSLHPRKPSSSEEAVFDWMQSIVQGTMPLESLATELGELYPHGQPHG